MAIDHGPSLASAVAVTVLVRPSMTVTFLLWVLAT